MKRISLPIKSHKVSPGSFSSCMERRNPTITFPFQTLSAIFLVGLILLQAPITKGYSFYCDIRDNPIVTLVWQNGNYLPQNATKNNSWTQANLTTNASNVSISEQADIYTEDPPQTIQVRYCHCKHPINDLGELFPDVFYCPLERSHCAIRTWSNSSHMAPPACVDVRDDDDMVRRLWAVSNISFLLLAVYLFCSHPGHKVLGCCLSTVVPRWNSRLVGTITTEQPDLVNAILLQHFRHQARREQSRNNRQQWILGEVGRTSRGRLVGLRVFTEPRLNLSPSDMALFLTDTNVNRNAVLFGEAAEAPRPVSLSLRTRIYKKDDPDDQEDPYPSIQQAPQSTNSNEDGDTSDIEEPSSHDNDTCCSICYLGIEDGERVGCLPNCNHIFHVDCLKVWLTRRNVCPLCLDENIAVPHYAGDGDDDVDVDNNNHASSTNSS